MKILSTVAICILPSICYAQNYCKYTKHKKFEDYKTSINSEHAGFYLNGINIYKKQFQVEGNGYIGSLFNSYGKSVCAGFLQLRYAINSSTEIQSGGFFQNPPEINADTLYNRQVYLGIKQKLFILEGHATSWYLAFSVKYLLQQSYMDKPGIRNGASFSLNNTLKISKILQLDVSFGSLYFPEKNLFEPLLSSKILMKNDLSKIGIFLGICGNQYAESLVSLGIHYTDNTSYILLISVGFLDKAVTPNISYTHVFRRY